MRWKAQSWRSAKPVETRYDLSKADVIVSLDADFLSAGFPGNVRYIRDFAKKRNPDAEMSRLYVVESTPSLDRSESRSPVAAAGGVKSKASPGSCSLAASATRTVNAAECGLPEDQFRSLWPRSQRSLQNTVGTSVIIAGDHQPPAVHALGSRHERGAR